VEQNSSSEANSRSASQETPHLLWNPKVRYCVHNSPSILKPSTVFRNELVFTMRSCYPSSNLQARGLLLVGRLRLLIWRIHSNPTWQNSPAHSHVFLTKPF